MRDLAEQGTTVLMTTHYLDEADQLCDRVSVVDHGRNLVEDTPAGLKRRIGDERLELTVADPADLGEAAGLVEKVTEVAPDHVDGGATVSVPVPDGVAALTEVASEVRSAGLAIADIGLRRPTLDEAFLQLTGQHHDQHPDQHPGQHPDQHPDQAKEQVR